MSQHDAIVEACRERARPIVMTTCAMVAGMIPTAMGLGEGSEFRVPMALAVIGGLISSTALSLVLVPVVYEFIDDIEMKLRPRLAKLVTARAPSDHPAATEAAQSGRHHFCGTAAVEKSLMAGKVVYPPLSSFVSEAQ